MRLEGLKRGAYTIDRPRWITTEEALEAWSASLDANVAPLTKRRLLLQTRRFLSAWDDLPWLLDREDVWGYAELYSQGCRNFCTASSPGAGPGCREGLDIGSCATSCPKYQSMAYETVGAHLQAVSNFFRFLEHHGVVKFNVAESVKKEWLHQNKHRKRVKEHRVPALADVQKLLSGQPNHALVYLLMAKTGPRVGEAMSLRVDFEHFERGRWFKVPGDEGKRRGNRYLFLDQELDAAVEKYLVWRRNVMLNCGRSMISCLLVCRGSRWRRAGTRLAR
jgi:integrase